MSRSHDAPRTVPAYALDSFALLVWLQDDPGADIVQSLLEQADKGMAKLYLSWMSVAEVYYIVKRKSVEEDPQLAADTVVEALEHLSIQIEPVTKTEAVAAARIKAVHAMSLADAFAAALAMANNAKVVTGDPEFQSVELQKKVSILWLPRSN